ncbi:MAG TPA: NnrU family protein [Desulfomonilaceae bacterium]|nr:NnrU family protein [Desulfomonilaceae bacterium]
MELYLKLGTVAILWATWCLIHSLLNSSGPVGRVRIFQGRARRYYRIFYNVFAIFSLAIVYTLMPRGTEELWKWDGPLIAIQASLWAAAFFVWFRCVRMLNTWGFLGLDAFRETEVPLQKQDLITNGIYGVIRHPQFLAGLIILWTRDLTDVDLVVNVVLTLYLIVGSKIEERRLIRKFGARYLDYMYRVPAFIPHGSAGKHEPEKR